MNMKNCAFLTLTDPEGWFIDDDLVHEPLKKLGWEVQNIPWNKDIDWNQFDIVVVRSPWDYQKAPKEFFSVLEKINNSKAILQNPLELMRWNINKSYLFDLQDKGVELVPTIKKEKLTESDIEIYFKEFNTYEIIIKPIVGANADDTYRISHDSSATVKESVCKIFENKAHFAQPFMNAIIDEGEFSLMFFKGKLSHTILKTVNKGDFRVQEEHGGGVVIIENPEEKLINAGINAMKALPEIPLYARVDLVRTPQNSFALMELELIEPALYFRFNEQSPEVFAKCIDDLLR